MKRVDIIWYSGCVAIVAAAYFFGRPNDVPASRLRADEALRNEIYKDAFADGLRYGARRIQEEAVENRAARYEGARREWFVWNANGHFNVRLGGPADPWNYSHDHITAQALMQFDAMQADLAKPKSGAK